MSLSIIWLFIKGLAGRAIAFLRSLPWQVYAVAALLGLGLFYGHLRYNAGQADVQAAFDAYKADQAKKAASVAVKQQAVTERVVTKYVDRIQVVREKGATIIQRIPQYVPSTACPLPGGFRLLHDSAALGTLPDAAALPDAAPVPADTAAETVVRNYTTCHATEEQLTALQEWVRAQAAVK